MSEIKFKDVAHFYLGCDVQVKRKNDTDFHIGRTCEVTRKSNHGDWVKVWFDDIITVTSSSWDKNSSNAHHYFFGEDSIKPLLRTLSDINTKDAKKLAEMIGIKESLFKGFTLDKGNKIDVEYYSHQHKQNVTRFINFNRLCPEQFQYLLAKGFDLFYLIETNQAIDKKLITA